MKSIYQITSLAIFLFFYVTTASCQTLAITANGDTIYVYDNGTWSFELLDKMPVLEELAFLNIELTIDTLETKFKYSNRAKKEVKNKNDQFKIKYDDTKWKRVPPATLNEDAEFAFESKTMEAWCMVISEETSIDTDALLQIAKNTMEERTGAEVEIVKTEMRNVNGAELIRGVLSVKISGLQFIFDTYYFSNDIGSVQFTVWTSDRIWEKNLDEIQELLNGFIVMPID